MSPFRVAAAPPAALVVTPAAGRAPAAMAVTCAMAFAASLGWLAGTRSDLRERLLGACRDGERSACCALGDQLTGDREADEEPLRLLRHACVELDPMPGDPIELECSCSILVESASALGTTRARLARELTTERCERAGFRLCPPVAEGHPPLPPAEAPPSTGLGLDCHITRYGVRLTD